MISHVFIWVLLIFHWRGRPNWFNNVRIFWKLQLFVRFSAQSNSYMLKQGWISGEGAGSAHLPPTPALRWSLFLCIRFWNLICLPHQFSGKSREGAQPPLFWLLKRKKNAEGRKAGGQAKHPPPPVPSSRSGTPTAVNLGFSHDVNKIQTIKLLTLLGFYFNDAL